MRIHIVNEPFMSREGQFEKDKHTLCIGIEVNALRTAGEYRVYIGLNRKDYYNITWNEAAEIYREHGKNALWKKGSQKVFILPLLKFRHGINKEVVEVKPKTGQLNLI